jgi:hypothetical protein
MVMNFMYMAYLLRREVQGSRNENSAIDLLNI